LGHTGQHPNNIRLATLVSKSELTNCFGRTEDGASLTKLPHDGLTSAAIGNAHLIDVGRKDISDTNINGQWRRAAEMRSPRLKVETTSNQRQYNEPQDSQTTFRYATCLASGWEDGMNAHGEVANVPAHRHRANDVRDATEPLSRGFAESGLFGILVASIRVHNLPICNDHVHTKVAP